MSYLCWEENVDLRQYNTFNVCSIARYLVRIRGMEDLKKLHVSPRFHGLRNLVLGGGSNILFATQDFDGVILKNEIGGIEVLSQDDHSTALRVGGGVEWTSLVKYCIENGLGGLENLSLIPGTVGAAPIQNIGAYGAELSDVILSLEIFNLSTGEVTTMSRDECLFEYRNSIFKRELKNVFITCVIIRVTEERFHCLNTEYSSVRDILQEQGVITPTIRSVGEAICILRRRKLPDPKIVGNAGSFFKNFVCDDFLSQSLVKRNPQIPIFPKPDRSFMIPAAWLIEGCGWKGKRVGEVGVFSNHALVLVNYGSRGGEIMSLAKLIVQDVQAQYGIELTPEVNIA
ncbi:unnamed protein product [Penicillium olsonii]|nr:unnamed protein product [Penicillium olsonii]CAG7930371.1 unnamed protein product [Penicillium olsonii]